ncbi:MAG TPA: hypothetical protein VH916_06245 [Dehalococcoidia bacterium]
MYRVAGGCDQSIGTAGTERGSLPMLHFEATQSAHLVDYARGLSPTGCDPKGVRCRRTRRIRLDDSFVG